MNRMQEVAQLFDLELNEVFHIMYPDGRLSDSNPYSFTADGLIDCDGEVVPFCLNDLLIGLYRIQMISFKPQTGDRYKFIDSERGELVKTTWTGSAVDYYNCYHGNCYRVTMDNTQEKQPDIVAEIMKRSLVYGPHSEK